MYLLFGFVLAVAPSIQSCEAMKCDARIDGRTDGRTDTQTDRQTDMKSEILI